MAMTSNKAQKTAARQRMAQTGEPYSVARRAVSAGDAETPGPDPDGIPGAVTPGPAGIPEAAGPDPGEASPEERYAQEAEAAGVPAAEIYAHLAAFRAQEAADWA